MAGLAIVYWHLDAGPKVAAISIDKQKSDSGPIAEKGLCEGFFDKNFYSCVVVQIDKDRDAKELEKQILTAAGKRTCTALAKNYLADIEAAAMAKTNTRTDELQIPQPAVRVTAADSVDTATSTTARHKSTR
ncbi:hypothetical protein BV898_04148 [Hypsibius exemplaris]|uniref:Uncharacterized protein n=1 Tax=Hypsibius exemplaris TaxID=2072580 RepID=A0A1W0X356_HYPEX|nr:hypothetical protein BV898_04148 [Hypsibius exemplaris]